MHVCSQHVDRKVEQMSYYKYDDEHYGSEYSIASHASHLVYYLCYNSCRNAHVTLRSSNKRQGQMLHAIPYSPRIDSKKTGNNS